MIDEKHLNFYQRLPFEAALKSVSQCGEMFRPDGTDNIAAENNAAECTDINSQRARCVFHSVVICMQHGLQEFITTSGKHHRCSPDSLPRRLVQMCLTPYSENIIIHSA